MLVCVQVASASSKGWNNFQKMFSDDLKKRNGEEDEESEEEEEDEQRNSGQKGKDLINLGENGEANVKFQI